MITTQDLSLKDVKLKSDLANLRQAYFRAMPEICVERAKLVTRFSAEAGLFEKDSITVLDKARLYRKVLECRTPVVWHNTAKTKTDSGPQSFAPDDRSPFAGSTTSKFKGVPLYPEFMALALWPELSTISRRKSNPYSISEDEIRVLKLEVFPRWMNCNIAELARARGTNEDRNRLQLLQKFVFFLASKPNCISHTIPDFSRAVRQGLRAVITDAQMRGEQVPEPERKDFYQAVVEVLEGIIVYSRKLAYAAASLAAHERDEERRDELEEIARIYRRVPELPAESFREGLTTVWVCWTAIHLENPNVGLSLGRLDQLLYELYRDDIAANRLDSETAVQLLGHLWLKIGDHVPTIPNAGEQLFGGTGSNQAITIGGVDSAGRDAVNELTYAMLRATELMKLRDPNLNARFHPEVNSDEYLRRLCEANINTGATPALHNDRAVIKALSSSGHTLEQARDYGVIGCVEPGSNGRFYGHSAAILLNLPSALELTLFNGKHRHLGLNHVVSIETGDPARFGSFGGFLEAFKRQTNWVIEQGIALNELFGHIHQRFYPTPILSALFEGPLEKGKDLVQGGATINGSGIAIIGLADVADSLSAIESVVYRDRFVDFATLLQALVRDYKGFEPLLARLKNPALTPHFGNDDERADKNARWIVQTLHSAVSDRINYRGGKYHVGYWTMTNHAGFARFIGAMPNGRKADENFASGLTPCSQVTPALYPALCSIAKLPAELITSGMAVNLKFTPDDGDQNRMLDRFVASVKGYFDAGPDHGTGGMEIQFNVTSHRDFLAAVNDPSRYNELLVRVSGYTAYFKDLNPRMQKEIIDRTEYQLSTGNAVPYTPFALASGE